MPDDLVRPTPCAGWGLSTLLGNMIGQNHGFAEAVRDGDADEAAFRPRPAGAGELAIRWRRSAEVLARAFEGAVVHTWDVARALGRDHRPAPDLLAVVVPIARLVPDGAARGRPGSAFAPALVPADTSADTSAEGWVATLALLGRAA